MASGLDFLLNAVKNSVTQHANDQGHTGFDPTRLLGHLDELFAQHGNQGFQPQAGDRSVRPASQDRYGDPADQGGRFGNVKPASKDPYGDPADDPRNH